MGVPTWKIIKIALNNLGAWLQLQMPMSMVKNVWQSLSGKSKPGKDLVLETLSQTSATGRQLGECNGVDMWEGVEDCLEEPQFSMLETVLQVSLWARGPISYVSEQYVNKSPSLSKEKT
jgi:hypothetical protein